MFYRKSEIKFKMDTNWSFKTVKMASKIGVKNAHKNDLKNAPKILPIKMALTMP